MSFTEQGISILEARPAGASLHLRLANANASQVLQCYVNGVLTAWQTQADPEWACDLSGVCGADTIFLAAVDPTLAAVSVWDEISATLTATRRLRVRLMRTIAPYRDGDRWRIYRGGSADSIAAQRVAELPVRDASSGACGFGRGFGAGGFGWDGGSAVGFGRGFGRGEFGFDANEVAWVSEPLTAGTYPVRVTILDAAGNESPAAGSQVVLTSPAYPAANLQPVSYDKTTSTLTFTFTPSKDIN